MSRAILLSVNPPHTTNIFLKKKRLEWRHRCLPQGKAYVYETKHGGGCGMVIGEVDIVGSAQFRRGDTIPPRCIVEGCVSIEELKKYTEHNPKLTGNLLQNAKRYDEPKPLSEFYRKCETLRCEVCKHLKWQRVNSDEYEYECKYLERLPIKRPPQSWCYVEELK